MELLDAAIALVITLAALATAVTVLMEIWVRFFGLKSQTQVELFQKIFDNAVKDKFPGQLDQWNFVKRVLRNPVLGREMHKPKAGRLPSYIGWRSKGIYEWVSDEHVYRRLLGMQGVLSASRAELVSKLKQFSIKYDEFSAAASVEFKNKLRRWSIIAGVLLAAAINIDGVRIFNEYVKRPELAAAMAAKVDELERTAQRAEARLQEALKKPEEGGIEEIENRLAELKGSIAELETAGVPIGWSYPPHCLFFDAPEGENGKYGKKDGGDIPGDRATAEHGDGRGDAPVSGDSAAGDTGKDATDNAAGDGSDRAANKANACRLEEDRQGGVLLGIGSIIAMLGTGVLIGLGAPFWFDVARRLAEVRSFFGGKGGGEAAHNGVTVVASPDGKTKSEKAEELINRVVDDALAEKRVIGTRRLLVERGDV